MKSYHTVDDVLAKLAAVIKREGNQERAADALGVSQTIISRVTRGKDLPSKGLLSALGYDAVTVYIFRGKK
jgi:transcriptional regulator with XRE-family HTH domain